MVVSTDLRGDRFSDFEPPPRHGRGLRWDGSIGGVWTLLAEISDPEIPVVSLLDLGIIRDVAHTPEGVTVTLTPTYAGCPATEVICADVKAVLAEAGIAHVTVRQQLTPAWTTDWISAKGRVALQDYGIAPPCAVAAERTQTLQFKPACPRCASHQTVCLSAFGATPCKALYRCETCREPFDFFKPL